MKTIKRVFLVVFCFLMLVSSIGCKAKSKKAIIYFEIQSEPSNLDPQIVKEDSELLLVRNLFEGLMRKNEKGEIVCGAAKSYKKDELTYTFTLREGLCWSDKSKVKADDFVFGIKRALQKSTGAPFASRLFSIVGAKEMYEGKPAANFGVKARGDKVVVTLKKEDNNILETLSSSVAMPCSEKYFQKTEGKYCQDASSIICNGSYDIFKWNKEKFAIRLYKNEYYKGEFKAQNAGVFFSLVSDKKQVDRLKRTESDMAFIPSNEIASAKEEGIKTLSVENKCWFLTIGDSFDKNTKTALLKAFSADVYKNKLSDGLEYADSIYPGILGLKTEGELPLPQYDIESAKQIINELIKSSPDEKFPPSTLYYYDDPSVKDAVNAVLGHWQQNLSAFINMQDSTSLDALQKEIGERTLPFALFPVTAYSTSSEEYLNQLGLSGNINTAQNNLLIEYNILPFAFQSTDIAYTNVIESVYMDTGNGYIDFAYIIKND